LLAIDIHDPANPRILGNYVETAGPVSLQLAGPFAFIGEQNSGLQVIDISDPAHMRRVGQMANYGPIESIAISGEYAFLATPWTGFSVVDISDVEHPIKIAELALPGYVRNIEVANGIAFVAAWQGGLQIVDILDPAHPRIVSEFGVSASVGQVRLEGDLLYARSTRGLHIIDVSDPLHPELVGEVVPAQAPSDVEVAGGRAYLASGTSVNLYDITNPDLPKAAGTVDLGGYFALLCRVSGAYAAVADAGGVSFGSVASGGIAIASRIDIAGDARAVRLAGQQLFVYEWPNVLQILDVSDPRQPKRVSRIPATGNGFAIRGGKAFVGDSQNGLAIFDITNPGQPRKIGSSKSGEDQVPNYAMLVDGRVAYMAAGNAGIDVIDIAEESSPRRVGRIATGGSAVGLAITLNYLLVANDNAGLAIFNLTNAFHPLLTRTVPISTGGPMVSGVAASVQVDGTRIYLQIPSSRIEILDARNLNNVTSLGSIPAQNSSFGFSVQGGYLLFGRWGQPLQLFDVANAAAPIVIASGSQSFSTVSAALGGHLAFAGTFGSGIRIAEVDLPGPDAQTVSFETVSERKLADGAFELSASASSGLPVSFSLLSGPGILTGSTVTPTGLGALTIEARQPGNASFRPAAEIRSIRILSKLTQTIAFAPIPAQRLGSEPVSLAARSSQDLPVSFRVLSGPATVAGNTLILQGQGMVAVRAESPGNADVHPASQIEIFEVLRPLPVHAGLSPVGKWPSVPQGSAHDVEVHGTTAYVAADNGGLIVLDVSNPAHPATLGHFPSEGHARGVAVSGGIACLADGAAGLQIIDISDPSRPVGLARFESGGWAMDVALAGQFAYVADSDLGLAILDLSDPANPQLVGSHRTVGSAQAVAVSGGTAFIAMQTEGIELIDVRNPEAPQRWSRFFLNAHTFDLAIAGNIAYVANGDGGLRMIDVTDPASPQPVGSYFAGGACLDVSISGGLAFLADQHGGFKIADVSNPSAPLPVGAAQTASYAFRVTKAGNYAYLACGEGGMQIFDVSAPAAPQPAGAHYTANFVSEFVMDGETALLSAGASGVQILDVSNPASPRQIGNYDTPGWAQGLSLSGQRLFVADSGSGFHILDVSNPADPVRLGGQSARWWTYDVAAEGNLAIVIDGLFGLLVYDISNLQNIQEIGSFRSVSGNRISLLGKYALVSNWSGNVGVVDLSNPAAPNWAFSIKVSANPAGVAAISNVPVVVDPSSQLPLTLEWWAKATSGNLTAGIGISGTRAFVPHQSKGIEVIDFTFLDDVQRVGEYLKPSASIVARNNMVYAAGGMNGFETFLSQPGEKSEQSIDFHQLFDRKLTMGAARMLATASSALPVTFQVVSGPATLSAPAKAWWRENLWEARLTPSAPGRIVIRAEQAGNEHYAPVSVERTLEILDDRQVQSIDFATVHDRFLAAGTFQIDATASSGLAVTFRVVAGPATVAGDVLTPIGKGRVTVRAEQAGDSDYKAAFAEQSFEVFDPQPQTVVFAPPAGWFLSSGPVSLQASASSGLPVAFRVVAGPGQVAGNALAFLGSGEVVVRAEQAGDDEWLPAFTERTIRVIDPQAQTIDFAPIADRRFEEGPVTLSATASSGLPVSFRVTAGLARVAGAVLTPMGYGPVTVRAEQPGRPGLWSAYAERTFTILGEDPETLVVEEAAHWPGLEGATMRGVAVAKGHAFLAGYRTGLQIVQLDEANGELNLTHVAGLDTPGLAVAVAVAGDYAYVADWEAGLRVIDITTPAAPRAAGAVVTPAFARGVAVAGNQAYVADWVGGVRVIDISNPASPKAMGHFPTDGWATAVAVVGSRAYVAEGNGGLGILNVSIPAAPSRLGQLATGGWAYGISVDGTRAGLADGPVGLSLIDVQDGEFPRLVGRYNSGDFAHGVVVRAGMAYVLDGKGLKLVEISQPEFPRVLGRSDSEGFAYGLAVEERAEGERIYLAEGVAGLRVLRVQRKFPAAP